jgi:hypothetical protein
MDSSLTTLEIVLIVALAVWSLVWKGFALWKAAGQKDAAWFVALLILNTAGLLEIFYIFVFSHHKSQPKE